MAAVYIPDHRYYGRMHAITITIIISYELVNCKCRFRQKGNMIFCEDCDTVHALMFLCGTLWWITLE